MNEKWEDLTAEEFNKWKNAPITKLFFKFVDDDMLLDVANIADYLASGSVADLTMQEEIAKARRTLLRMLSITHEDINNHYNAKV